MTELERLFPLVASPVPWLSTEQMVEVDRAMMEDAQIGLIQMMENAGRTLAHLARHRFLEGDPRGRSVVVLAGTGGNGGGALVAARRLHNWGASVTVAHTSPDGELPPVPKRQLEIVRRMGIGVIEPSELEAASIDLMIDGVIGYSLSGAPRGAAKVALDWANAQRSPVLSLDAPSGVDTTTGKAFEGAVRATATLTLALPKEGLRAPGVDAHVGELYLADISVPPELYAEPALQLEVGPVFATSDVVRLS